MHNLNRFAVLALLLVLPLAIFAQSQSSSQATASSSEGLRMSQLIGEKALFSSGEQAGTVRDVVVGDKGDFSYLVIEFNRDVLGAGTSTQSGTTAGTGTEKGSATGTTQTPAGTTGTNTTQSGTTSENQTPAGASTTGTSGTAAAAANNRYLVPVTDVTFDVANKTVALTISPNDVLSLPAIVGDEIPATLGVSAAGSMTSNAPQQSAAAGSTTESSSTSQSQPSAQSGTSSSTDKTQAGSASTSGTASNTAQSGAASSSAGAMTQANVSNSAQFFLGSKLKDYTFVDSAGKDLGKVNDAMFDLANHQIAYLALGVGGFLGIGEKLVAIPITDITSWDTANHKIMVTLSSDQVKNAQGIDKGNWPITAPSSSTK